MKEFEQIMKAYSRNVARNVKTFVSQRKFSSTCARGQLQQQAAAGSYFEEDQLALQKTAKSIIDNDINPYVEEWEASGQYPAKQVFKKLAEAGLLGVNKPVEYGGMGLDFKYSIAFNETMGHVRCGAVPMSVAVQTDMATPALARYTQEVLICVFYLHIYHPTIDLALIMSRRNS